MWLYYVLLGPAMFVLFLDEFNKTLSALRKCQDELASKVIPASSEVAR